MPMRCAPRVLVLGQGDGSIGTFRDVVAIDSVPVLPKDDRLPNLFKKPTAASVGSAQEMTDDAVRAYITPHLHIVDGSLMAVDVLGAEDQPNYTYKIEGSKTVDGVQTVVNRQLLTLPSARS